MENIDKNIVTADLEVLRKNRKWYSKDLIRLRNSRLTLLPSYISVVRELGLMYLAICWVPIVFFLLHLSGAKIGWGEHMFNILYLVCVHILLLGSGNLTNRDSIVSSRIDCSDSEIKDLENKLTCD